MTNNEIEMASHKVLQKLLINYEENAKKLTNEKLIELSGKSDLEKSIDLMGIFYTLSTKFSIEFVTEFAKELNVNKNID